MDEEKQSTNPYAAPAASVGAKIPDFDPDNEIREFHFGKSLAKWLLICFVCAAPSFYFGSILGRNYFIQSAAMVMGILTYVAIYVYVESLEWTRRKLVDRRLRISVKIGYVTRIVISILFPLGMFVDIWCGFLSVGATSSILGGDFGSLRRDVADVGIPFVFCWFYATTLVQGTLMNIVLGAYTLIVYAIALLFRRRPNETISGRA